MAARPHRASNKAVVPVGSRWSETRPIASLRWAQLSHRGIRFRPPRPNGSVEQIAIECRSSQLEESHRRFGAGRQQPSALPVVEVECHTVLTRAPSACDTKTDGKALKPMAAI